MDFDIVISFAKGVRQDLGDDIEVAFQSTGLRIAVEEREEEVFGAFEWVVPTAIAVFFAQNYLGPFLQEAAKDHYTLLKTAFRKLLKKTSGPDREITIKFITSAPGKVFSPIGPALSVYAQTRNEVSVKFTFSPDLRDELHDAAIDSMFIILREHYRNFPADSLTHQIEVTEQERKREVYMRFNEVTHAWELIDLKAEAIKQLEAQKRRKRDA